MDWKVQFDTFGVGTVVAILLTSLSLVAGVLLGSPLPGLLEIAAVFTSFACTFLFVIERRQAYVWGVVTTILYSMLFFDFQLPGSAFVQIYLLGALFYGFFRWGRDGNPRPVTTVRPLWLWGVYVLASAVTWYGAKTVSEYYGQSVPPWDAAILALSILAQWLLDNKKLETWGVWIILNAIAVPVYWSQGLSLVAAQYVLFGLNAIWGYYMWYDSRRTSIVNAAWRDYVTNKTASYETEFDQ